MQGARCSGSPSEILRGRPQVQLLRPGAAVLLVQLPVCLRNCISAEACARIPVWKQLAISWTVYDPINDDVRHMNTLHAQRICPQCATPG